MPRISIYLPFEVVGRVLGGVVQGVAGGIQVIGEALTADDIPPPAAGPPGPMPTPISNPMPPEDPVAPSAPPRAVRPAPDQYREVIVQPGEYLVDIASRELGRADRWREIAALNQIFDTKTIQAGQVLLLPD